jgi:hypothetical protein
MSVPMAEADTEDWLCMATHDRGAVVKGVKGKRCSNFKRLNRCIFTQC